MNPYVKSLFEAVQAHLAADRNDEAIALLKQAGASGADDSFFLYMLENCQFKTG